MQNFDRDPVIRPLRSEDDAAVAALYSEVFGESAMCSFVRRRKWQFEDNPACDSLDSLMWVAELAGEVVGFFASFPTRFRVLGNDAVVRLPADLMVSQAARGCGVGERLIKAYIQSEDLIVNVLGYSPASGRIFHRLGYRAVDAERLRVRPCRSRPIVEDLLARRRNRPAFHLAAASIAGAAGTILDLGLRAFNRLTMPRVSDTFEIRYCTIADGTFDELWQRISPMFPIAAVRDRSWVQWRFLEDPNFQHSLLCAYDSRGTLQGYVDVRISDRRNIRFGRIVDLFCDPENPKLAESLLAAGAKRLESDGVDLITCLGHVPGIQRVIAKYCYLSPKRLQRPALFIWKGDPGLQKSVYDADNWHLTHADGDDGFSP